jgi:hypothetical protein
MSSLQKFNQTLNDFGQEVEHLQAAAAAYKKIGQLAETGQGLIERFKENNRTLGELNDRHKEEHKNITQSLKELTGLLDEKTELIRKESKGFYDSFIAIVGDKLEEFNSLQKEQHHRIIQTQTELSALLEKKTDLIRKENKDFYKDFEGTVRIKLDEHRLQIRQLIEQERDQIRQIFELEFARNTAQMKQAIEAEATKQTALLLHSQRTIRITVWVVGGLTVILSALAVIKLWILQQ